MMKLLRSLLLVWCFVFVFAYVVPTCAHRYDVGKNNSLNRAFICYSNVDKITSEARADQDTLELLLLRRKKLSEFEIMARTSAAQARKLERERTFDSMLSYCRNK